MKVLLYVCGLGVIAASLFGSLIYFSNKQDQRQYQVTCVDLTTKDIVTFSDAINISTSGSWLTFRVQHAKRRVMTNLPCQVIEISVEK